MLQKIITLERHKDHYYPCLVPDNTSNQVFLQLKTPSWPPCFFPPQKSAPFFGSPRYRRCLIKCLLCECAASRKDMLCVRDAALGCNQWLLELLLLVYGLQPVSLFWPPTLEINQAFSPHNCCSLDIWKCFSCYSLQILEMVVWIKIPVDEQFGNSSSSNNSYVQSHWNPLSSPFWFFVRNFSKSNCDMSTCLNMLPQCIKWLLSDEGTAVMHLF